MNARLEGAWSKTLEVYYHAAVSHFQGYDNQLNLRRSMLDFHFKGQKCRVRATYVDLVSSGLCPVKGSYEFDAKTKSDVEITEVPTIEVLTRIYITLCNVTDEAGSKDSGKGIPFENVVVYLLHHWPAGFSAFDILDLSPDVMEKIKSDAAIPAHWKWPIVFPRREAGQPYVRILEQPHLKDLARQPFSFAKVPNSIGPDFAVVAQLSEGEHPAIAVAASGQVKIWGADISGTISEALRKAAATSSLFHLLPELEKDVANLVSHAKQRLAGRGLGAMNKPDVLDDVVTAEEYNALEALQKKKLTESVNRRNDILALQNALPTVKSHGCLRFVVVASSKRTEAINGMTYHLDGNDLVVYLGPKVLESMMNRLSSGIWDAFWREFSHEEKQGSSSSSTATRKDKKRKIENTD